MKANIFSLALISLILTGAIGLSNTASAENLLKFETANGEVLQMFSQEAAEAEEPIPVYVSNQANMDTNIEGTPCLNLSLRDLILLIIEPEQEDPLPFELS